VIESCVRDTCTRSTYRVVMLWPDPPSPEMTALGVRFAVASWDDANKVAAVLSALGAVAAVAGRRPGSSLRVRKSGKAAAEPDGRAVSGFAGKARWFPDPLR
jgi:hypothetical protein